MGHISPVSVIKLRTHILKIIFFAIILLSGCGVKQNIFVLIPDDKGVVGKVIISNSQGTTILDQAGEASRLSSAQDPPSPPYVMDAKEIASIFGPALQAQPSPPEHFILYFEQNSATLGKQSLLLVEQILETIKNRKSVDTSIVGHTDTAGDKQYNYELSVRRAEIVSELLISRGVDPEILEVTSHGEKNLLIQTEDDISEARNRRVEITVR